MPLAHTTVPAAIQAAFAAYFQTTPTGPIPIVCPEVSQPAMEVPTQTCSFYIAFFIGTQLYTAPVSVTGPGPGVASGMTFGPATPAKGSTKVFIQGQPMARSLSDFAFTNGTGATGNAVGIIMPNQATIMNLSA